jgi:hypothetical protein
MFKKEYGKVDKDMSNKLTYFGKMDHQSIEV